MGDAGGGGAGGGINVRTRLFGTLAVKTGLASPKQVEECIAEQNAARAEGRTPPRLGEIMAQKGYLSREQVQAILRGDFAEPGKRFGELCIGMQFCTLEQVTQCLAEQQKLRDEGAVQRIGTVLVKHGHLRAAQIPAVLAAQNIEIAECGKCRISYNVAINSPESALKCVRCGRDLVMVVEEIDASPVEDIKTVPRGTPIPLPQAGVVPAEPLPPETLTASASSIIVEEEEVSLDELMGSDSPGVAAVEEAKVEEVPEQVAVEEAQEVEVAEAEEAEAAKEAEEVEEAEDAEEAAPIEAAPSVEPLSEAPEEIPEEAEAPVYGDYRVLQKIGQDAAGALFQAEHVGTGEVVALKIIELERTRDRGFFDRFVEDAKKAAALKHPALKRIISAGRAEGRLFYVSDFVSGKSLRLFLEGAPGAPTKPGARRRMSIRAASRIVRTVAEGLAYAHERGVFHGDIRPSNILIMPDGRVILSETGVPKNVRANAERLVQMHGVTPFYLAPELAMPDGVADARTDIYELGATFYHMVTGQPPFTGNSPLQIFMRMAEEEALPADTVVADFPRAISDLISDMMSPEPGDRFQTMDEVVSALERASDVTSGRSGTTGRRSKYNTPGRLRRRATGKRLRCSTGFSSRPIPNGGGLEP